MVLETTRRQVLRITGGTLAIGIVGTSTGAAECHTIEPDTEIVLEAEADAWIGVEPDGIADEENPTLGLTSGESYEITFENVDGATHNLEIVDDDDDVVDDYETEDVDEEGDTETLQIDEVTDEMAEYVCRYHEEAMRGEIDVQ